ncbi:MAG: T9SS type A sorting domain-containing protein [Ignavibacteria bacterium]|jgi:hypothetical protein|nr:T9SS type A sorting domain-containing protein [Ignavibacteria bacterium]
MIQNAITKIQSVIIPLSWLLLICSSYSSVGDTIYPKLNANKTEIDLCNSNPDEKEFYIVVELGQKIEKSDSLISCELVIGYDKTKIMLDNFFTTNTLFEQFTDYGPYKFIDSLGSSYNLLILQAGNLNRPASSATNIPLVVISGKFITNDWITTEIFIEDIAMNNEFKHTCQWSTNSVATMTAVSKNLPERTLNLNDSVSSITIKDLSDSAMLQYGLITNQPEYLKNFTAEISLGDENNIEINNININNSYTYEIVYADKNKIIADVALGAIPNETVFCTISIIRTNADSSVTPIIARIYDINKESCSMNNEPDTTYIICNDLTSIIDENTTYCLVKQLDDRTIQINTIASILNITLYDILGNTINANIQMNGSNEAVLYLPSLPKGLYYLKIDNASAYKIHKLIIN